MSSVFEAAFQPVEVRYPHLRVTATLATRRRVNSAGEWVSMAIVREEKHGFVFVGNTPRVIDQSGKAANMGVEAKGASLADLMQKALAWDSVRGFDRVNHDREIERDEQVRTVLALFREAEAVVVGSSFQLGPDTLREDLMKKLDAERDNLAAEKAERAEARRELERKTMVVRRARRLVRALEQRLDEINCKPELACKPELVASTATRAGR